MVGWLGYVASQAKSELEQARDSAQLAKESLSRGDATGATTWVDKARVHAQSARDATHSFPWVVASAVPWAGSPLKAGQEISDVVLGLVGNVLQPAVSVGEAISPDQLLNGAGRLDVELLRNAAPQLVAISTAAKALDQEAEAITDPAYLASIRDARSALQAQTADLAGLLDKTSMAAQLAPSMFGADGPRTYFMGFQTNAEARGTGGLLGGFGILRFDDGAASVDALGRNNQLDKPFAPVDLGTEFNQQYGFVNPSTDYRNSNISSHFPYAARIWQSMWEQQSGTRVDGAIAIDPVALSYVLAVVGPVTMPDGEVVTADNVVELTESTAYVRFADDNDARKQYLQDIAGAVVTRMTDRVGSPRALLDALGRAAGEGRIAVWSSVPADQKLLEETPLAHIVPEDPAPYAEVLVNNLGGNKLDYYLTRQIKYTANACESETRSSAVTVRLTNDAPDAALTSYVAGSEGLRQGLLADVPNGTNLTMVSLLATKGADLTAAYVDGRRVAVFTGTERGHPVYDVQLRLERGRTAEVKFELTEPTAPGAPRVPVQPLRDTPVPLVSVPVCTG